MVRNPARIWQILYNARHLSDLCRTGCLPDTCLTFVGQDVLYCLQYSIALLMRCFYRVWHLSDRIFFSVSCIIKPLWVLSSNWQNGIPASCRESWKRKHIDMNALDLESRAYFESIVWLRLRSFSLIPRWNWKVYACAAFLRRLPWQSKFRIRYNVCWRILRQIELRIKLPWGQITIQFLKAELLKAE